MKKSFFCFSLILALSALTATASDFSYNYPVSSGALSDSDYVTALDSASNLHAVYLVGGQIKYRHNLDGEETVATGALPDLTIDPATNQPAITFVAGGTINYAWRNSSGVWQNVPITTGVDASLATDATGITHISYLNDSDSDALNEIFYTYGYGYGGSEVFATSTLLANGAYCNNQSCRVTDNYLNPNIKVDSGNRYHIMALEQYRNDTLAPNYQDYLFYLNASGNKQGSTEAADSINLRSQYLDLDPTGPVVAVWANGSNLKTSTLNPSGLIWSGQNLELTGTNPSLDLIAGSQNIVYENGGVINYHEATSSGWSEALPVATGTKPTVLADTYRYIYYLNGSGQLYLTATRDVPDFSAPTATIVSGPSNPTTDVNASFVIGGTDVFAYKYKLDNGSFSAEYLVANALALNNLSVGSHTLAVIGRDGSNNWQAESASATYTWIINTPTQIGGGGGGGGGSPSTTTPSIEPEGRVLGASTFQFRRILRRGMSGLDVQELQKILQAEKFLKTKTATKYFGPSTTKALIAWKKKHKIRPYTGVLSKPNLKYLNNLGI
ncbi:MAG: peptidoglycan-binding protein [Patescibacteria group bacterium]|jgi:hypothetical protein